MKLKRCKVILIKREIRYENTAGTKQALSCFFLPAATATFDNSLYCQTTIQRTEKRVKFFKLQTVAYTKLHPDITVVHQHCIMVAVCSQSNYILVR